MATTRDVLVLGGGAGGLLTALILSNEGHTVTLLERDPEPPPATDAAAWDDWTRTGVNQFRQPHGLLGRARQILQREVPDVWAAIEPIGTHLDARTLAPDPAAVADDEGRLRITTVRRATVERHLALAAERDPRIEVRRGVAATGLVTGLPARDESPHVVGVLTAEHGDVTADLVVDACGRRSPVGDWVAALGCPVQRSAESDGFTYFSRWYRHDGDQPPLQAGVFGGLVPGLVALIFPGDGGTVGIAMAGTNGDRVLRRLRDPDRFEALTEALPLVAPWVDPGAAHPITDVIPMGSIQNRHLRLRTDDGKGVTGLVNTADSVVSTNPSLGRGIAIAGDLALELRTLLRDDPGPGELIDRWDAIQLTCHRPWLTDSIQADTLMREAFEAMVAGRSPGPPAFPDRAALQRASTVDIGCWRRWIEMNQCFERPDVVLGDAELMATARVAAADAPPPPAPVMGRSELELLLV